MCNKSDMGIRKIKTDIGDILQFIENRSSVWLRIF